MTRIMHISDTHGNFLRLNGSFDCVVHSGDFFPNSPAQYNSKSAEAVFQVEWMRENLDTFKQWIGNKPYLFTLGNHDFCGDTILEILLRAHGIKAFALHDKIVHYEGMNFYGFPYVPYINGSFNFEKEIPEMQEKCDEMVNALNTSYVDVFVCHAPLYGILDLNSAGHRCGSTVMADAFKYKLNTGMQPNAIFHGHIHNAHGIAQHDGLLISNAATTQNILEI